MNNSLQRHVSEMTYEERQRHWRQVKYMCPLGTADKTVDSMEADFLAEAEAKKKRGKR